MHWQHWMNFSIDSLDQMGGAGRRDGVDPPVARRRTVLDKSGVQEEEPQLTAWEKWILRKAHEEAVRRQTGRRRAHEQLEKQYKEKEEAIEHARKTECSYREWLAAKADEDRRISELRQKKTAQKTRQVVEKQEHLDARTKVRFSEWSRRKEEEMRERERRRQEIERGKAQQDAERRQRAQEAYTTWLKRAHTGSVTQSGTDQLQYGTPSFHNQEPWIGPLDSDTAHSNTLTQS